MKVFNIYILIFFIGTSAFSQVSKTEQDALKDLYRFTQGENWTVSWNLNEDVSTWKGVSIENDKVVGLHLGNNNLEGELPSTLGNLMHLKRLDLSSNSLSGEIPEQLGALKNIEVVALSENELSGEVPANLFQHSKIKELKLANNVFERYATNDAQAFEKF